MLCLKIFILRAAQLPDFSLAEWPRHSFDDESKNPFATPPRQPNKPKLPPHGGPECRGSFGAICNSTKNGYKMRTSQPHPGELCASSWQMGQIPVENGCVRCPHLKPEQRGRLPGQQTSFITRQLMPAKQCGQALHSHCMLLCKCDISCTLENGDKIPTAIEENQLQESCYISSTCLMEFGQYCSQWLDWKDTSAIIFEIQIFRNLQQHGL